MSSNYARPKWWQVYLTFPLLIALFLLDNRLKLSTREHEAVQIGILVLVYRLIHLWIRSNAKVLSEMDQAQLGRRVKVIKIQPYLFPTTDNEYKQRPMFQLPGSEIKGVLSDTFEMDYIDAKFISSLDEVPQELNKE